MYWSEQSFAGGPVLIARTEYSDPSLENIFNFPHVLRDIH